jgi:hypothetical protein
MFVCPGQDLGIVTLTERKRERGSERAEEGGSTQEVCGRSFVGFGTSHSRLRACLQFAKVKLPTFKGGWKYHCEVNFFPFFICCK